MATGRRRRSQFLMLDDFQSLRFLAFSVSDNIVEKYFDGECVFIFRAYLKNRYFLLFWIILNRKK